MATDKITCQFVLILNGKTACIRQTTAGMSTCKTNWAASLGTWSNEKVLEIKRQQIKSVWVNCVYDHF